MSDQENMFRMWLMTLVASLNGFTMASLGLYRAGEEDKIPKILTEVMPDMLSGYTPEQRGLLATELSLMSGLANRVEPFS